MADCGTGQARRQLADPTRWWLADAVAPHSCIDRLGGTGGAKKPRAPAQGNKASNHLVKTPVGVEAAAGETPSLTGELVGETHRGLEHAQAHPLGNQHQRGPM